MIPLILAAVGGYFVADSLSSRKKFAKGGGVDEKKVVEVIGKVKNNNPEDLYYFTSNSKGLEIVTNHKNIEVLSIGNGKYDFFLGWDDNKQSDGVLYFGKWNNGFLYNYDGNIRYAKGGGVEGGAILKSLMDTYRPLVLKKIEELEFNIKKMADEMTDAEYEEKFSKLSENKKNRVKSQIRLGESPKVALANVLFDADEVGMMAKGGQTSVIAYRTENRDILPEDISNAAQEDYAAQKSWKYE